MIAHRIVRWLCNYTHTWTDSFLNWQCNLDYVFMHTCIFCARISAAESINLSIVTNFYELILQGPLEVIEYFPPKFIDPFVDYIDFIEIHLFLLRNVRMRALITNVISIAYLAIDLLILSIFLSSLKIGRNPFALIDRYGDHRHGKNFPH